MTLHFDPFGDPLCDECRRYAARNQDRLDESWRAVLLRGEKLGPIYRAYFVALHERGHVKSEEERAVDDADERPHSRFQRILDAGY